MKPFTSPESHTHTHRPGHADGGVERNHSPAQEAGYDAQSKALMPDYQPGYAGQSLAMSPVSGAARKAKLRRIGRVLVIGAAARYGQAVGRMEKEIQAARNDPHWLTTLLTDAVFTFGVGPAIGKAITRGVGELSAAVGQSFSGGKEMQALNFAAGKVARLGMTITRSVVKRPKDGVTLAADKLVELVTKRLATAYEQFESAPGHLIEAMVAMYAGVSADDLEAQVRAELLKLEATANVGEDDKRVYAWVHGRRKQLWRVRELREHTYQLEAPVTAQHQGFALSVQRQSQGEVPMTKPSLDPERGLPRLLPGLTVFHFRHHRSGIRRPHQGPKNTPPTPTRRW